MNKARQHIKIFLEKNKDRWVPEAEIKEEIKKEYPNANPYDVIKFLKDSIDIADSWNQEKRYVEYRHIIWLEGQREKVIEDLEWFDSL